MTHFAKISAETRILQTDNTDKSTLMIFRRTKVKSRDLKTGIPLTDKTARSRRTTATADRNAHIKEVRCDIEQNAKTTKPADFGTLWHLESSDVLKPALVAGDPMIADQIRKDC